jgi:hypothetical protein
MSENNVAIPATPDRIVEQVSTKFSLVPDGRRLAAASQIVKVQNTDPHQVHVVVDRFLKGHEILPGQIKEVEMLVEDIEGFMRQRLPGRGFYPPGARVKGGVVKGDRMVDGQFIPGDKIELPPHPLLFPELDYRVIEAKAREERMKRTQTGGVAQQSGDGGEIAELRALIAKQQNELSEMRRQIGSSGGKR